MTVSRETRNAIATALNALHRENAGYCLNTARAIGAILHPLHQFAQFGISTTAAGYIASGIYNVDDFPSNERTHINIGLTLMGVGQAMRVVEGLIQSFNNRMNKQHTFSELDANLQNAIAEELGYKPEPTDTIQNILNTYNTEIRKDGSDQSFIEVLGADAYYTAGLVAVDMIPAVGGTGGLLMGASQPFLVGCFSATVGLWLGALNQIAGACVTQATINGVETASTAVAQIKNTASSYLHKVWNSACGTAATNNNDVESNYREFDTLRK